jgi:GNAT superfamily N-acetyltransferase
MNDEEMLATLAGTLTVRPARAEDAETVAGILEEAAHWLTSRGIDQWRMGDWLRPLLAERIGRGEVYLAWLGDQPVATLTLQWSDEQTWGAMPDDAGYLHSLAVWRAYGGQGIGLALLGWAERTAAMAGRTYLRLDCMARNGALRSYYEGAGFVPRDDLPHDVWSALYEKRVSQPRARRTASRRRMACSPSG